MTTMFRPIILGIAGLWIAGFGSSALAASALYSDSVAVLRDAPEPEDLDLDDDALQPQVSWSATYASRYTFQGFDYSDGHPVLQPEVTGTMGAVSLNLWGNLDQIEGRVTEVDATVRAGWSTSTLAVAAGYANLQYPNRVDRRPSQELFAEIGANLPLSPDGEIHWDVDAAHGVYGAVGVGAERSFGGVTCGLDSHLYAQNKYYGLTGISGLETSIGAGVSWRGIAWQGELARLWTWENGDFRNLQQVSGGWLFRFTLSSQ